MRIKKTSQYIEGGATLENTYGTSQINGYTQSYFDINDFTTYTSSDMTITSGSFDSGDATATKVVVGLNSDKTLAVISGLIQFHKSSATTTVSFNTDIRPSKTIDLRIVIQRSSDSNMTLLRTATINTSGTISIKSSDVQQGTQFFFLGYPIMLKVYENIPS